MYLWTVEQCKKRDVMKITSLKYVLNKILH